MGGEGGTEKLSVGGAVDVIPRQSNLDAKFQCLPKRIAELLGGSRFAPR
jgi:hypothetical protein